MNIDDKEILDRIERLAKEVGAATKPTNSTFVPREVMQVLRYHYEIQKQGGGMSSNDTVYHSFTDGGVLTYGQIRQAVEWFKTQYDYKVSQSGESK